MAVADDDRREWVERAGIARWASSWMESDEDEPTPAELEWRGARAAIDELLRQHPPLADHLAAVNRLALAKAALAVAHDARAPRIVTLALDHAIDDAWRAWGALGDFRPLRPLLDVYAELARRAAGPAAESSTT